MTGRLDSALVATQSDGAGVTSTSSVAIAVEPIARQRIPLTIDPFGEQGAGLASTLQPIRTAAITRIYAGLDQVRANLANLTQALGTPDLAPTLIGALLQPDGSAASTVQVQFDPSAVGRTGQPVTAITDVHGGFTLTIPSGTPVPSEGLPLTIHGAGGNAQVTVPAAQVAANGMLGTIDLPDTLAPLPVSIISALSALVPTAEQNGSASQPVNPPELPKVRLGESGACSLSYGANNTVDSFPFGVFFRLVEPQLSIVQEVERWPIGRNFLPAPIYATEFQNGTIEETTTSYTDRIPVEQPLSADGFRDQIMGLQPSGIFTSDETVPMAATLGLGYVLSMAQQWTFSGVGLGDLVYSLPLAPGEQQEVAVYERVDTATVSESEFLTESQAEEQQALADTSTAATFNSAFNEAASGGSAFQTQSSTSSWGANFLIAGGGSGESDSSGSASSWLQGQRDSAEQAAQSTHSAAENQASARRSAARTAMRMASATESESVTTKTITNHNHAHALTVQYWGVQRLYDVTTVIDGLTLACLVPMQIVRFMGPGQPLTITDPTAVSTPAQVLDRYAAIIKHIDLLSEAVPRVYQHGLTLLEQFASNPTSTVEPYGGLAEDVINFQLTGTFVACEDISIAAVTDRGTRVGPVRLSNPLTLPQDTYATQDDLVAALIATRQDVDSPTMLQGNLALPQSMSRTNIVGFEITRAFRRLDYTLISTEVAELNTLNALFGSTGSNWINSAIESTLGADTAANQRTTVHVTPSTLEDDLGGPQLVTFYAYIEELNGTGPGIPGPAETYANDSLYGVELPPQPYPVPALQVAPVLRFNEILEIERMTQHVLRNTTLYSKAIWSSLSAEERAIMLDQYTIGVPPDGISDETQMIPLLNCVQNKLLGFFGNSMVLPFMIPQSVADSMKIDPAAIQSSLLAYQQATFAPPRSTIALPTDGVLGEAVLGHCPSAEKIDLLRFWNWQDSESDTAPTISPVTVPTTTPSIADSLQAPNTLGQLPSLINNVLTAPTPDTTLLQALTKAGTSEPDFSSSLTGATQLAGLLTNAQNVSNSARADALKQVTTLQSQAMATVGNIVGGVVSGNTSAGSSAASAANGTGGGASSGGGTAAKGTKGASGTKGGSGTKATQPAGPGAGSGAGAGGSGAVGADAGGAAAGGTGTGGAGLLGDAGDLLA